MNLRQRAGVLCIDSDFNVIFASGLAEEYVFALFHARPRVAQPIPSALRECVAALRDGEETTSLAGEPVSLLKLPNGSRICLHSILDPGQSIQCLIFEERHEFSAPEELAFLGVSPRETNVAFWILHEKTNWEIGRILQISTRTVDKHVEKIFRKLGVNDRRHLEARVQELR